MDTVQTLRVFRFNLDGLAVTFATENAAEAWDAAFTLAEALGLELDTVQFIAD